MAVTFRDIDGSLEHECAKRDARNPSLRRWVSKGHGGGTEGKTHDEGENEESHEDQEHDTTGVVVAREHINGCDKTKDDIENTTSGDWRQSHVPHQALRAF